MKSIIRIFESQEKAVSAIKELQNAGYAPKQLMIVRCGKKAGLDRIKSISSLGSKEIGISAVVGAVLGILTAKGGLTIPGMGFLFGWGAWFGGYVGFLAGMLVGGVIAVMTTIGIEAAYTGENRQNLPERGFSLIVNGTAQEIEWAKEIIGKNAEPSKPDEHL